jgi:hypothetical protein
MIGQEGWNGRDKKCVHILVGKSEGKTPLGRHRCREEENIRMGLGELWWEFVHWIHMAQNRDEWRAVVSTVMKLRVP